MTTQNVTIPALSGGSFSAYLAVPSTQPYAGIVLIQEILGFNQNTLSNSLFLGTLRFGGQLAVVSA